MNAGPGKKKKMNTRVNRSRPQQANVFVALQMRQRNRACSPIASQGSSKTSMWKQGCSFPNASQPAGLYRNANLNVKNDMMKGR
jgi:hypothetical protein